MTRETKEFIAFQVAYWSVAFGGATSLFVLLGPPSWWNHGPAWWPLALFSTLFVVGAVATRHYRKEQ